MSYILDALKKSESKRLSMQPARQTPVFTDEPEKNTHWLLLALLFAGLIAAGIYFYSGSSNEMQVITKIAPPPAKAMKQATTTPVTPPAKVESANTPAPTKHATANTDNAKISKAKPIKQHSSKNIPTVHHSKPITIEPAALVNRTHIAASPIPAPVVHSVPTKPAASLPVKSIPQAVPQVKAQPRPAIQAATDQPPASTKSDAPVVFKPVTPSSPFSRAVAPLPDLSDETGQASPADANISSRHDLPLSMQKSLPNIKIDGHIYDENPSGRMVIINGAVYREKQAIPGGLTLEEITPDGVILSYHQQAFHLGIFEH